MQWVNLTVAALALLVGTAGLIWQIIKWRIERREQRLSKQPHVKAVATYKPPMVEQVILQDGTTVRVPMGWSLGLHVVNTGNKPLYLDRASLHYSFQGGGGGVRMVARGGSRNPVAPGDDRYFTVAGKGSAQDLVCPVDIGNLKRDHVWIEIWTPEKCIHKVQGSDISWVSAE